MVIFWFLFSLVPLVNGAPLNKKIVDMTYTFDETTLYWPEFKPFKMESVGSKDRGFWLQTDEITSATHVGTHMDAPVHFAEGGLSIDQIPVSRLIAPAAVVDIAARAASNPDEAVTVEDLLHWEAVTGQSLNGTVLLMRTGWGRKWGDRKAFIGTEDGDLSKLRFPGLDGDAARWLVANRDIVGIGTETLSFDVGKHRDQTAHKVLLGHGMYALENIANMDQLPIYGATLHVMPMKIGKASGAPTRIVATIPNVVFEEKGYKSVEHCKETDTDDVTADSFFHEL